MEQEIKNISFARALLCPGSNSSHDKYSHSVGTYTITCLATFGPFQIVTADRNGKLKGGHLLRQTAFISHGARIYYDLGKLFRRMTDLPQPINRIARRRANLSGNPSVETQHIVACSVCRQCFNVLFGAIAERVGWVSHNTTTIPSQSGLLEDGEVAVGGTK